MINERRYIKDAIYDWVAAVVSEEGRTDPVIWDNEDGPRPRPPFVSLEFTGTSTPGSPDYSLVDVVDVEDPEDNGTQTISRCVRRALTMYAFGEGALDLLETIKASLDRDVYIEMLEEKGLAIPQAMDVAESPVNRSGISTENSAFFEFYVMYIREITDSPGWIGTTEIHSDNLPMEDITDQEESSDG